MSHVVIMRGISGSGKTTIARTRYPNYRIVSADNYRMVEGKYTYSPLDNANAHAKCFRSFIGALEDGEDVVVDNTNCTPNNYTYYLEAARAFNATTTVCSVFVNPILAAERNVHSVPHATIVGMFGNFMRSLVLPLPGWVTETHVRATVQDHKAAITATELGMMGEYTYSENGVPQTSWVWVGNPTFRKGLLARISSYCAVGVLANV